MNPTEVERRGEGIHGVSESAEKEIIRRVTRSEDPLRDELLWGIPNEVTLAHIATMLPRRAYEVVARVNPDWQRAFQGRMVYDSRVRTQTTQKFLVFSCRVSTMVDCLHDSGQTTISRRAFKNTFSLFSPSEERWYTLPPIPASHEGRAFNCSHVLLDGSIYLLGGTRKWKNVDIPSAEVLVLDLAGQPLEWRRCASMQASRRHLVIGVMHGKIFVFGGLNACHNPRLEVRNEVYDPKVDAWSFTAPTMPLASVQDVFSIGQQFFACIGLVQRPRNSEPKEPLIDGKAKLFRDTKFVLRVGDKGPKLISARDDDAEDDMDGLHEIFENQLVDLGKRLRRRHQRSPAERLASKIRRHEQLDRDIGTTSFYGFYDPVKDEWREFDKESLGKDIDEDQLWGPKHLGYLDLRPRRDGDRPGLDNYATASVWSMSL